MTSAAAVPHRAIQEDPLFQHVHNNSREILDTKRLLYDNSFGQSDEAGDERCHHFSRLEDVVGK